MILADHAATSTHSQVTAAREGAGGDRPSSSSILPKDRGTVLAGYSAATYRFHKINRRGMVMAPRAG